VAFGRGIGEVVKDGDYTESEMALVNRVLPLIVATIDDRSWRVRWTAASKFAEVIAAFDPVPDAMDSLVPAYEKLLQDPEAEVCVVLFIQCTALLHSDVSSIDVSLHLQRFGQRQRSILPMWPSAKQRYLARLEPPMILLRQRSPVLL